MRIDIAFSKSIVSRIMKHSMQKTNPPKRLIACALAQALAIFALMVRI